MQRQPWSCRIRPQPSSSTPDTGRARSTMRRWAGSRITSAGELDRRPRLLGPQDQPGVAPVSKCQAPSISRSRPSIHSILHSSPSAKLTRLRSMSVPIRVRSPSSIFVVVAFGAREEDLSQGRISPVDDDHIASPFASVAPAARREPGRPSPSRNVCEVRDGGLGQERPRQLRQAELLVNSSLQTRIEWDCHVHSRAGCAAGRAQKQASD